MMPATARVCVLNRHSLGVVLVAAGEPEGALKCVVVSLELVYIPAYESALGCFGRCRALKVR